MPMPSPKDVNILRSLAAEVAQIAALPVQQETIALWKALNSLKPRRPMVAIDQICWNEMDVDGELALHCEDAWARGYEDGLRKLLYKWRHMPGDMVVDDMLRVPMAVRNTGLGVDVAEEVRQTDAENDVVSHAFINQFETDADLDRIQIPVVTHDKAETARRVEQAREVFGDILNVQPYGVEPYLSLWDPVSMWMSAEGVLLGLIDRPDYMKELARRVVEGYMAMLDQLEMQNLLARDQQYIHCTGAFTDELPRPGQGGQRDTEDIWMFGLAQIFASASPAMFEEFEIEMCMPLFQRFGLVYYGCCDPLDRKMAQVRQIPHLRKVSMSPWADERRGALEIGGDYVFSRKPNPALLAWDTFSEEAVREHLKQSVEICAEFGCPLELILKDISTVRYDPKRLWRWHEIAMDIVTA